MILIVGKKDVAAFATPKLHFANKMTFQKDTIPQKSIKDTIPANDSLKITDSTNLPIDSTAARIDSFELKISKDTLSGPVKYFAEDSIVGFMDSKVINLYGKAKTEYEDLTLTAPEIGLNQKTHMVTAKAGRDSTGEISEYAEMKQGEDAYKSEGMEYNFKTQKGITKGTITQQGEMFVHSDIEKKVNESTMYGMGTFFTTCNLDHPHFGFRARRSKIINKKLAITGAVRPEFDSVPVPIYLPFGIYPLSQGRHSGMLAPSIEQNDQMGLGLSRLGYYHVINDYWDVQVYGNIYSWGSWSGNIQPTYRKIYKYSGSLNFGLQQTIRNAKRDPDYSKVNTYTASWSHSSDTRSRPGVTFSANVNMASTRYNENIPNNAYMNYNNTSNASSITYSKTWQDKPFSLTASANHNQNNQARLITLNLPNVAFTVNTIYPFQKKESVGTKKWYEQLGIGYQLGFQTAMPLYDYSSAQKDSLRRIGEWKPFYQRMLDTLQWNGTQSIPITLSLPPILGGAVMVSPSISYSQTFLNKSTTWSYRPDLDSVVGVAGKDLTMRHQMSMGISFNSALYGTYQFKNKRVQGIRHVIRPNFSLSYSPDLNRNNWTPITVTKNGITSTEWYDKLSPIGTPPVNVFTAREFGGISFGLDNNLEMRIKAKNKPKADSDSTDSETTTVNSNTVDENVFKKLRLIDGFGFTSSYNLFADSMQLSPFNLYFRTNLFDKINLSANGIIMPYKLDANGVPTKQYAWDGGRFNVGTLTSASISMSTSFQSKPKDEAKAKAREEAMNQQMNDPMLQADQQRLMEYMRQNPAEFVDFNTQWSVNISYSLNYTRPSATSGRYLGNNGITSSASFNGSFNLTPKWNFSVNGYYDFRTSQIQTFTMSIARDLHCWQIAVNVTPVGMYKFFNFTISPKAGILQDLKVNRSRSFFNGGPRY